VKEVLKLIAEKQQEFTQLPLFSFLHDRTIDPRQRLAFAPIFAPFVMGFGELNKLAFREEPTDHPIQKIINQHSYEDDSHWIWFLEDLKKLELNPSLSLSDALRFLWGEDTHASRHMIYELYRYTYQASPIQKLIVIEAVEATADVFLTATARAAKDLQELTNREYRYFGELHFSIDTGHSLHFSETEQWLETLELTEEAHQEAFESVELVFQIFTDYFNEILAYVEATKVLPLKPLQTDKLPISATNTKRLQRQEIDSRSSKQPFGKRLGSYLLDAGLLTPDQLKVALQEQEKTDQRLGDVLADQGWVSQNTIEYLMEKIVLPEREMALERSLTLAS
jgi:hypothetical protein